MSPFFSLPLFALFLPLIPLALALAPSFSRASVRYAVFISSLAATLLAWLKLFATLQQEGFGLYVIGGALLTPSLFKGAWPRDILFYFDSFTALAGLAITLPALLVPILMKEGFDRPGRGAFDVVFYCLSLIASLAIVATADLFSLYFWVQVALLALCALIAGRRIESQKVAMKSLVGFSTVSFFMLMGVAILYARYSLTLIPALAQVVEYGMAERAAFLLILLPLLFLMGLPPFNRRLYDICFASEGAVLPWAFLLFVLALSFGLLRVFFGLFGSALAVGTFPLYLILLSVICLLCLLGELSGLRERGGSARLFILFQSALFFLALTVSFFALKSPFAMAQYGLTALQGTLLLLIFYPSAAAILLFIQDIAGEGSLSAALFLSAAGLLLGLPPFAGYTSRLLIVHALFVLNPLLATAIFFSLFLALAALVRTRREVQPGEKLVWRGELKKTSPAVLAAAGILLLYLNAISFFPVSTLSRLIAPAVQSLVNETEYAPPAVEAKEER